MINYKKCLAVDLLFEGGRMSVGAVSVAYLLSTGLPVDKIAYLKIIQALVLFLGEIPTGVFADAFGSRKSLHAACVSAILGFTSYALGSTFFAFCIGEILLALALCFWSGAYEAFSIDSCNLDDKNQVGLLDKFFHQNQTLNGLGVLMMGWLGGITGRYDLHFPFYLAALMMTLAALVLFQIPETHQNSHRNLHAAEWLPRMVQQASETKEQILLLPALVPFFAANILIQFSIQPILHYWQPFFQQYLTADAPVVLGNIFAAYCGASILCSFLYSKLSRFKWTRTNYSTLSLFMLFSILYVFFARSSGLVPALIFFIAMQGVLSVARTLLAVRLNEIIPSKHRASILSTVGLISRLGMMGALASIGHFLGNNNDASALQQLFETFGWLSLTVIMVLSLSLLIKSKKSVLRN